MTDDWFKAISPLGKTPVLQVGQTAIFESAVILECLEETLPAPLHPSDPLQRAEDRAWIEFGSAALNDIAGFYTAQDAGTFAAKTDALAAKFDWLERKRAEGPYFDGEKFSPVDAAFGPVFRYFDVFDRIADFWHSGEQAKSLARGVEDLRRGRPFSVLSHQITMNGFGFFSKHANHILPGSWRAPAGRRLPGSINQHALGLA